MSTDGPAPAPATSPASARPAPPPEVVGWAEERAAARTARDWPRADALKAAIEAAGWKVEDAGRAWSLFPVVPPDVVVDGVVRYGSAAGVPSVLGDPASAPATVIAVAEESADTVVRLVRSLVEHAPPGTEVVIVGNDPDPAQDAALAAVPAATPGTHAPAADADRDVDRPPAPSVEVLRTSQRLGAAAALNVGMQRARGAVVILATPDVEITADAVSPLVDALADPGVAVAGAVGISAAALPRVTASDASEPDAIDGAWLAFRRADFARLGPFDERFVHPACLDAWWSLVLRAGDDAAAAPRRAVRLDLPVLRSGGPSSATRRRPEDAARADRMARRNGYRLLDRFRDRPDLVATGDLAPAGTAHG